MSDNTDPRVSIIVNCLNGEKFLQAAIDSVVNQDYKSWELIVWDNASADNTGRIARAYEDRLRYYRSEQTEPLGTARNKALDVCKGYYIAFLDCDDVWNPTFLRRMVGALDGNPECGMVYTDGYKIDESGRIIGRYFDGIECYSGDCFDGFFKSGLAPTPSEVVFRQEALSSVGAFDTDLDICEDYALYLKITRQYPVLYIPEPLISYRIHANNSVKKSDILVKETRMILEGWMRQDPQLRLKYAKELEFRQFKMQCKLIIYSLRKGDRDEAWSDTRSALRIVVKRPLVWLELAASLAWRRIVKYSRLLSLKYS